MDDELSKSRRNLLIITSIVLLLELSGAKITSINAPAVALSLERPEMIKYFIWVSLCYELIRFQKLSPIINYIYIKRLKNDDVVINHIKSVDNEFQSVIEKFPFVTRGVFSRKITYLAHSNLRQEERTIPIPYRKCFMSEFKIDIDIALKDKEFFEYILPVLYAKASVIFTVGIHLKLLCSWLTKT